MVEAEFFRLLQDAGEEMTDKQRADYERNNNKRERGRITFNMRLYPKLHKLADNVYKKMIEHEYIFCSFRQLLNVVGGGTP